MALEFPILQVRRLFAYQRVAHRASQMRRLGMSVSSISRVLGVTDKTIAKALRWARVRGTSEP